MNNKMVINIYLSTIKSKKQNNEKRKRNVLIDMERILMVARWEGVWGLGENSEGIKKYTLIFTEKSWGHKVQYREYSQ